MKIGYNLFFDRPELVDIAAIYHKNARAPT